MRVNHLIAFLALCLLGLPLAGHSSPSRPKIKGLAFVRLRVSDIGRSREFYEQTFQLGNHFNHCAGANSVCFRLSSSQAVELVQAEAPLDGSLVEQLGFWTEDLDGMRRYLTAAGIEVGKAFTDYDGRKRFELRDPEGHGIAFVSPPLPSALVFWPDQVSKQMLHAGFVVKDMSAENHFYRDLLGFRLYWSGGFKDVDRSAVASEKDIDWYEIQVPDGDNWIEYMLNIPANADRKELGVQNHFSLGVINAQVAAGQLRKNGLQSFDGPEVGRDGKNSLDAYDPDGTRIEVMEFVPTQKPCCHPYTAAHPKP
ncbi:MAG TPA: VOC family protein [Candidatus Acidoferrum sp.]|jgi:catechol 2,3-dioxygenase-like lactoylglutathione lyase family enzyme